MRYEERKRKEKGRWVVYPRPRRERESIGRNMKKRGKKRVRRCVRVKGTSPKGREKTKYVSRKRLISDENTQHRDANGFNWEGYRERNREHGTRNAEKK
jgi:hypothetical protein